MTLATWVTEEDNSMKRLLLVVGPVFSIAGAVGLILFGKAIVGVLDGVLTYRVVNPPEPFPASLGELGWAALSGIALALGLVISCVGTAMRDSQTAISPAGKILQVVAGILLFIGTVPVLWGVLGAKRGFFIIATSAMTPKPEDLREMVVAAAPMLTVGCAILLIGSVVLLVAGQLGTRAKPPQTIGTNSVFGALAASGSVLLGVASSFLFLGIWGHGSALEAILGVTEVTPKPSELAQHLSGILNKSLLAFILVGCMGVLQVVATIFAPTSKSDAATQA
jgi:hypothetical protein